MRWQRVASELGDNLVALEAAVATKAELERCLERTGVPAFLTPQS